MFGLVVHGTQSGVKSSRFRELTCCVLAGLGSISNPAAMLRRLPRVLFFSGLLIWACFFVSPSVEAAQGVLDTTFGVNGLAITDFGSNTTGATSIAIQTDGKIIAAGGDNGPINFGSLTGTYSILKSRSYTTLMSRYNSSLMSHHYKNFLMSRLGKKRLMSGPKKSALVVSASPSFALARYNTNGLLDISFGTGGLVTTSFGVNTSSLALSTVLQPNGKIVAAGSSVPSIVLDSIFVLARYSANGSLDTTFGTGGLATTSFGASTFGGAFSVALQSTGKILAAGTTIGPSGMKGTLARYDTSGVLDATFGTGGLVTTSSESYSSGGNWAIHIQPNGKIVSAGFMVDPVTSNAKFVLARYTNSTPPPTCTPLFGFAPIMPIYQTGATLTVTAQVAPWPGASVADAYINLQTPGGAAVSLQLNNTFTVAPTPMLTNWTVAPFSGTVITHTFSGSEPPGSYALAGFFTQAGTFKPVGPKFCPKSFTFMP